MTTQELERLIDKAREHKMSPEEREAQRRDFAYGNAKFENEYVTRDMVDKAAEERAARGKKGK